MQTVSSPFLRRVLLLDAIASGATGLLLAFGAAMLAPITGIDPSVAGPAGYFLIPYAGLVAWLASRPAQPVPLVWAVVAVNILWVVESLGVLALGYLSPNVLGLVFVIAQAVVVGVFAELQILGLKKARASAAA
ncbi:MAG TPA: hypothetical protein VEA79_01780 [Phenylobacterium sp.]|nr:hypothetical protein [Phenylobacterium sp.]